ncbi:MAG: DUF2141 domain-containing protein [Bacteroidetes bacterium]|nr:DUF2141 domain-containing protein [Bacteroidota bacterium]
MKILSLFFLLALVETTQAQRLVVRVENIKDDKGQIGVALYNTEVDFMKKQFAGKFAPAKKEGVEVVFENLPAGEYAISIMHDSNANGKIDTNFMGIPKEGYGFSNNVMGSFGPPSFEKAKFKLTDGVSQIKLRY